MANYIYSDRRSKQLYYEDLMSLRPHAPRSMQGHMIPGTGQIAWRKPPQISHDHDPNRSAWSRNNLPKYKGPQLGPNANLITVLDSEWGPTQSPLSVTAYKTYYNPVTKRLEEVDRFRRVYEPSQKDINHPKWNTDAFFGLHGIDERQAQKWRQEIGFNGPKGWDHTQAADLRNFIGTSVVAGNNLRSDFARLFAHGTQVDGMPNAGLLERYNLRSKAVLDIMDMHTNMYGQGPKRNTLGTIYGRMFNKTPTQAGFTAHNDADDAMMTAQILEAHIQRQLPLGLDPALIQGRSAQLKAYPFVTIQEALNGISTGHTDANIYDNKAILNGARNLGGPGIDKLKVHGEKRSKMALQDNSPLSGHEAIQILTGTLEGYFKEQLRSNGSIKTITPAISGLTQATKDASRVRAINQALQFSDPNDWSSVFHLHGLDYTEAVEKQLSHAHDRGQQISFEKQRTRLINRAREKGSVTEADLYSAATTQETLEAAMTTAGLNRLQEREARMLSNRQNSYALSYASRGDSSAVDTIKATNSIEELNAVLMELATSARDAKDATKEKAQQDKQMSAGLNQAAQIPVYDWTRWSAARNEAWGSIKSAGSWIPGSNVWGRLGDSGMQMYTAAVAQKKGYYDAFAKGAAPLGMAIGTAVAPGAGTLIGGIAGGVVGSISQIVGNIGEGNIRSQGLEISSKLNMWGAGVEGVSALMQGAVKLVTVPLKALGTALKLAAAGVLGASALMASGMKQMGSLGNPLSALTGSSSYRDYQAAGFGDIMSGLSSGSTYGAVAGLASTSQSMFIGDIDTNKVVAASLLGEFNSVFMNRGNNVYGTYSDIVTRQAQSIVSNPASASYNMNLLSRIDPTLAQQTQTYANYLRNQSAYTPYLASGKSLPASYSEYINPKTWGIPFREMSDLDREKYRIQSFSYQAYGESMDVSKIKIASTLWNKFGNGVIKWVDDLVGKIAGQDSLQGVFQVTISSLKDVWATLKEAAGPEIKANIKGIAASFTDLVVELVPVAAKFIDGLGNILYTGFQSIVKGIWGTIGDLIMKLSNIHIDPAKLMGALTNQNSIGEAFVTGGDMFAADYNSHKSRVAGNINYVAAGALIGVDYNKLPESEKKYLRTMSADLLKNGANVPSVLSKYLSYADVTGETSGALYSQATKYIKNNPFGILKEFTTTPYTETGATEGIMSAVPIVQDMIRSASETVIRVVFEDGNGKLLDEVKIVAEQAAKNIQQNVTVSGGHLGEWILNTQNTLQAATGGAR